MSELAKSTKKGPLKRRFAIWKKQAGRNRYFKPAIITSLLLIVIDQISKHLILANEQLNSALCSPTSQNYCGQIDISSFFDLTMVWNRGVSFGLGAGGMLPRVFFSALSIVVALYLLNWLANLRRPVAAYGVGFIIAGALGNAYDRIVYGAVVDFIDFSSVKLPGTEINFPWIFNIADVAINVGVALLAIEFLFLAPKRQK